MLVLRNISGLTPAGSPPGQPPKGAPHPKGRVRRPPVAAGSIRSGIDRPKANRAEPCKRCEPVARKRGLCFACAQASRSNIAQRELDRAEIARRDPAHPPEA